MAGMPSTPQPAPDNRQTATLIMTAMIFLLAGLLIATLLNQNGGSVSKKEVQTMVHEVAGTEVAALRPTLTPIPPTPTLIPSDVASDDDPFLGPADAPVVIVEFSDFQCGYCAKFYEDTLPLIVQAYPDQVKFVYRDFPIFGDDSVRAAMAAECANEQGLFWEMHNRLFDIHNSPTPVTLDEDTLIGFASELGLDVPAFTDCLTSNRYLQEVTNDYQAAIYYGFQGTPGFIVNGVVYRVGAQPFSYFDNLIKQALATGG